MGIDDKVNAAGKNIEGKLQEAAGNITGDSKDKMQGKAKQVDAEATNAKEDLKDEVKKRLD
ncbi:CsbD family protein [Leptolyngbya sp. FACHB-16]|uniref:CsbD family protein n=1 Tax=unclassified Leptolyngbya TaxID=2650499 RepID=UPI001689A293|nr:CsbD family protein [Leptolyngbya sp. FACHB-16]MBD2157412.1 CsbD family protein [Leptolyngbya sp. FACHB-16]